MDRIQRYLEKNGKYSSIFGPPSEFSPDFIIIIPAYKENHILETLNSVKSCSHKNLTIEIIIYVNGKENDTKETQELNLKCEQDIQRFNIENDQNWITVRSYSNLKLRKKESGVGRARKFLMDDALYRFEHLYAKEGVIINLDADSKVKINYLEEIRNYFSIHQNIDAVSIHFEHDLTENCQAILDYELHLRYFINMQAMIHLPFAFQTIGSSMAVRSGAYAKVGGMPGREAGEDFYFLHKFSKIGTLGKLTSTTVFPSSRTSDRVPFGTGRAILDYSYSSERKTYHYKSFILLEQFISQLEEWYNGGSPDFLGNKELENFAIKIKLKNKIDEIKKHTSSFGSFKKRFFQYFDAFKLMKYLHWMRDHCWPDIPLSTALMYYADKINMEYKDKLSFLKSIRDLDQLNEVQA